jgi:membrane protein implicated in regulation of membrane protease activity
MNTIFWAVVLVVATLVELATFQLVSIWFAIGSLFALVASLVWDFPQQLTVFIVSSMLLLILTRPILKKRLKTDFQPTNHELNVGKVATVIETVDGSKNTGRVNLDGVEWTALTETPEPIEVGSKVIVLKVDGSKLWVKGC